MRRVFLMSLGIRCLNHGMFGDRHAEGEADITIAPHPENPIYTDVL